MSELPDIGEYDTLPRQLLPSETLPEPIEPFEASLLESPNFGLSTKDNLSDDGRQYDGIKQSKPLDLSQFASVNFSNDSLGGAGENWSFTPKTPVLNSFSPVPVPVPYENRHFNNTSKESSPILPPQISITSSSRGSHSRQRPKSAMFMLDANNSISEHPSPVHGNFNNTPRSRNSVGSIPKSAYLPSNFGPPLAPSANTFSPKPSSPSRSSSPTRARNYYGSKSPVRRSSSPSKANPFNFNPQEIMFHSNGSNSSLNIKPAHRKGHKYKHSSVSMNLFQEPVQLYETSKQLLEIPDLYPIPNFRESFASINLNQKFKLFWSFLHFSLSLIVFVIGFQFKLSAFSTLAHLIFYDALGSLLIVLVDIMSNFEVWNNSSIAYPFGLGRLEVLVGFALSASLIMVGLDLISHFAEEFMVELMAESPEDSQHALSHHIHDEAGHSKNWFVYELMLLITIGVTLITSNVILVRDRINDMISEDTKISKGNILDKEVSNSSKWLENGQRYIKAWAKNPTHLLTLSYSSYLIVYPLLSQFTDMGDLNEVASLIAASLLCYIGWKLVTTLGGILLCSYPYSDYDYHVLRSNIVEDILALDFFKQTYVIKKMFITNFNYELFVVGVKLEMKGATADEDSRIRFEIHRIIKRQIEQVNYISSQQQVEITIDINRV